MIRQNEIEEIIGLINKGFDLEELSFELEIPIEQIEEYRQQLELRKFVKQAIKSGQIQAAVEKLNNFIKNKENNIIEKFMLLKLNAYIAKTGVNEDALQKIEADKKAIGFSRNIDEILDELGVQIPKRKSSNIRRKERENIEEQELVEETQKEEEVVKPNYEETIKRYKKEIDENPKNSLNKRNLLAFVYFKAGRIEEAKDELMCLIEKCSSYTAYRQLIHLEKCEGNFEDAKLWAYEGIENYPDSITFREQLISIAKEEKENQEVIKLLKEIISISPEDNKNKNRLITISRLKEREL